MDHLPSIYLSRGKTVVSCKFGYQLRRVSTRSAIDHDTTQVSLCCRQRMIKEGRIYSALLSEGRGRGRPYKGRGWSLKYAPLPLAAEYCIYKEGTIPLDLSRQRRRLTIWFRKGLYITPTTGIPPTASPIDVQTSGWEWTKLVVPSIGPHSSILVRDCYLAQAQILTRLLLSAQGYERIHMIYVTYRSRLGHLLSAPLCMSPRRYYVCQLSRTL